MDADSIYQPVETPFEVSNMVPATALEAMADRLRHVRRQLSRGRPLAGALDQNHHSFKILHAAERLDRAVRRLSDTALPKRIAQISDGELPWLVRIVERRAQALESMLSATNATDRN